MREQDRGPQGCRGRPGLLGATISFASIPSAFWLSLLQPEALTHPIGPSLSSDHPPQQGHPGRLLRGRSAGSKRLEPNCPETS